MSRVPSSSPRARLALGALLAALGLAAPLAVSFASAPGTPVPGRAGASAATTFVVTSAAHPGDGVCDADCTLAEAITAANADPGFDRIEFNVVTSGIPAVVILGGTPLPTITGTVHIDGYTQPGSSRGSGGQRATLRVVISGGGLPASSPDGLVVTGGGGRIEGINLQGFTRGAAVVLRGAGAVDYDVMGNWIGTSIYGTDCVSNVGGGPSGGVAGVIVEGGARENYVGARDGFRGNVIGCNGTGVLVRGGATATRIDGNEVVANMGTGITVEGPGTARTHLEGNLTANNERGLVVQTGASQTEVRGNWVGANRGSGIRVESGASQTLVIGNHVGVYPARAAFPVTAQGPAPNQGRGVYVNGANGTTVDGNVLSANDEWGVEVRDSRDVVVDRNLIGLNAGGTATVGNRFGGVRLLRALDARIRYNAVSGNRESGARTTPADGISIVESNGAEVLGNRIGLDLLGNPLPNSGRGLTILRSSNTSVGSSDPADENQIAFNEAAGITIGESPTETGTTGNRIRRNGIWENGGLGVDLGNNGKTDVTDPASLGRGPNGMPNSPLLSGLSESGGAVQVKVTLVGRPNGRYTLRFFESDRADGSGYGEGQRFLTQIERSANSEGLLDFRTASIPITAGSVLSATATDTNGNTSEFSNAVVGKNPTRIAAGPAGGTVAVGVPGTPGYVVFRNVTSVRPSELEVTVSPTEKAALQICLPQPPPASRVCQTVNVQTGVVSVASVGGVSFQPSMGLVGQPPAGTVAVIMAQAPGGFLSALPTSVGSDASGNPLAGALTTVVGLTWRAQGALDVVLAVSGKSGVSIKSLLDAGIDEIKRRAEKLGIPTSPLIGNDGSTLLAQARLAGLIGLDGSTLVGNDGASLVTDNGAGLISNLQGSLVGDLKSLLIGNDGSTLIGLDGSTLVNSGGLNVIARDGAGLIGNDVAGLIGLDNGTLTGGKVPPARRQQGGAIDSVGPATRFFVAFLPAVRLDARVLLEGAVDPAAPAGSMRTALRATAALSRDQPYDELPFLAGPMAVPPETFLSADFWQPNTDIVDWVVVELRVAADRQQGAFRRVALLKADGRVVDYDLGTVRFVGVPAGSYRVAVYHRNHLAALSAASVSFSSGTGAVDFTAPGAVADDAVRREVAPGRFALRLGDVDADGALSPADRTAWFRTNDRRYTTADLDLSGEATASDYHERLLPALGVARSAGAPAPGTVDGRLVVGTPAGDGTVSATLQLRAAGGAADLGTSTLQIAFDPAAVSLLGGALAVPTTGATAFADSAAVHASGPGVASVDLDLVASASGRGVTLGADFTDVATLRFDAPSGVPAGAFAWGRREVYDGAGGAGGRFTLGTFAVVGAGNVADETALGAGVLALAAGPNPVRQSAVVRFSLPAAGAVRVTVVDVLGREVAVLADDDRAAGAHEVAFDTGHLASGAYAVRLAFGGATRVARLTVVR